MRRFFPRPSRRWLSTLAAEAQQADQAGHYKAAARAYATVVRMLDDDPRFTDMASERLPVTLTLLAVAQDRSGDRKSALRSYLRLASIREARGEMGDVEFAWEAAARCCRSLAKLDDAEAYARNAVDAARREPGTPQLMRALAVLGAALQARQQLDEAFVVLEEALDATRYAGDEADEDRLETLAILVQTSIDARDVGRAQRWLRELRALCTRLDHEDVDADVLKEFQGEIDRLAGLKERQA